ncbi:MAG: carbohydrate binding domain-containing protein, partial [Bacteroidota bacterium]
PRKLPFSQPTLAAHKLNGIQQNDWKYNTLDQQPPYYFDSVLAFRQYSDERHIGIIPGVAPIGYSDGILYNNPRLAEGFPATATVVVEGDTGRLLRDPNIMLPNGSFENLGSNGKFSGWSYYDDLPVTQDAEHHGGSHSALCQNFTNGNPSGNCRFNRKLTCKPFHAYRMSAWVKTESLKVDEVRLLAIGTDDANNSRSLTYTAYSISGTNGWTRVQVSFNSLQFPSVLVYAGVWGGKSGKIWWDDFTIEESGLSNIIRRDGTPLTVRNNRTGALCAEGTDFAPISDSLTVTNYLQTQRFAPEAPAPTFRRRPGGSIANGDTVTISYFHPLTTVADEQGGGSVMVCPAEEELYPVLRKQIRGVDSLYNTTISSLPPAGAKFFMGHDEIRSMNWDSSCRRQHLPPSALLANNLKRCQGIIEETRPGAETFVWSDMFDSLHNASNNYYLINGDLTGVWDSIPTTPVIVNWNSGNMEKSLSFFADHGFRQITSPYYDAGSADGIRAWRMAMEGKEGMLGMMYTTWGTDYNFLVPFSYYAWGAGPYIVHVPYDSSIIKRPGDTLCFSALILPDPYDKSDKIQTAAAMLIINPESATPVVVTVPMYRDTGNIFIGCMDKTYANGFLYSIQATNAQGISRKTPLYDAHIGPASGAPFAPETGAGLTMSIAPNPAKSVVGIRFVAPAAGRWRATVRDLLGRLVERRDGEIDGPGERTLKIDLGSVPNGLYRVEMEMNGRRAVETVMIVR